MKYYLYVLVAFLFLGCSGKTPTATDTEEISNIINLSSGLKNIQAIKLSEIADSVSFIPFETNSQSLQGMGQKNIRFSDRYIYYYEKYYDWNGKHLGNIVKRGQGPYEEIDGGDLLYKNNHFYSHGSKFIEYDMTGKPTGKVRNLYASREFGTNDFLRKGSSFSIVEENFVVYDFPTTLYYFNRNFETIDSRIVFTVDTLPLFASTIGNAKYITCYKEKLLFYNFINDTIFYVKDTDLEPKWIVSMDESLRLPNKAILDYGIETMRELILAYRSGYIEDVEFIKLTDHKHKVIAAYETDLYLLFEMTEIIQLAKERGKEPPKPYIVLFDKRTGKTTLVKGNGFVDDILGMDTFYPQLGVFDEKLITYIWPFQFFDYIKECRNSGREVNPQLLALSKKVKEDDNPILILAHLKK